MSILATSERKIWDRLQTLLITRSQESILGSQEEAHLGIPQLRLLTTPSSSRPQMSWGVQGQPVAMRVGSTELEAL